MVIYLYGADSYRRQKKTKELVADYNKKYPISDLGHFNFSVQDEDKKREFIKLQEFFSTPSLFVNKKLGILENAFFKISAYSAAQRKELKAFFKAQIPLQDSVLIISEENKPPTGFDFLINEKALSTELKFQEFKRLEYDQLKYFIKKEAGKYELNLSCQAINLLAESFNSDSWGLVNEIKKLSLIRADIIDIDKIKEVSDYVRPLVDGKNIFYSIISIINSQPFSLNGQDYRALIGKIKNLEILFLQQEESAKIFNILASQAQSLKLAQKIADYDSLIKFGRLNYEEALLDLIINY